MIHRDDKDAARFLRHQGHWNRETVIDAGGTLYGTFQLSGMTADLAGAGDVTSAWLSADKLRQGISDPRVELWTHFVRMPGHAMRTLPSVPTWTGRRIDEAYRSLPEHQNLYRNVLYITVVMRRASGLKAAARSAVTPLVRFAQAPGWHEREFRDLCRVVEDGLRRYGVRRLRAVQGTGTNAWQTYSQVFEAWRTVATCRAEKVGISSDPMGRLIVPDRPVFGDDADPVGRFLCEGTPRFFACLSFLRYPGATVPYMLDAVRGLPVALVITNAERFQMRQSRVDAIDRRVREKETSGTTDPEILSDMMLEASALEHGQSVPVQHHFLATIHAASLDDLEADVSKVRRAIEDRGITLHRQGDALKPAFYSQVPGNLHVAPNPTPTNSRHAAALAALHNAAPGRDRGLWGAPALVLRTLSDTEYPLHLHVPVSPGLDAGDRGNIRVQGPPGSGKTVLLNLIANGTLRASDDARVFCLDNRLGMSTHIEAQGGSYAVLSPGRPAVALLRTAENTPVGHLQVRRIITGAILTDGQGPLLALEDDRLTRGIARQMCMAPERRSLWGVLAMLPNRPRGDGKDTASKRLEPWCRGKGLGWALDAAEDALDLTRRIVGVDTTDLLKDARACGPVIAAVLDRMRTLVDGRPFLLIIDEAWQIEMMPELESVVGHSLATVRKDNGVVVLATQMAESYGQGRLAAAYRNQVPQSIWFADGGADRIALARDHNLTDAEIEVVTEMLPNKPYHFLLKTPAGSLIARMSLAGMPGQLAILSSRGSTYRLMRELQARHGRDPEAWAPAFERLAPGLADDPIQGRAALPALLDTPLAEAAE